MSEKFKNIAYLFYPIYMLIYFLGMFRINLSVYLGYPMIVLVVISSIAILLNDKENRNKGRFLMVIWMLYNLFSIILYLVNNMSVSCYVWALRNYFFPIFFFFVGNYSKTIDDDFYKIFLWSCAFFFIVGLYLYYVMPSYYVRFLYDTTTGTWYAGGFSGMTEESVVMIHRFSSFSSSTYVVSAFSVAAMICSLGFLFRPHKAPNYILYGLAMIGLICAILCQQRIAMACSLLVFIFYSVYGFKYHNVGIFLVSIAIFVLGSFALGYSFANSRLGDISVIINERMGQMSYSEAIGDRFGQVVRVRNEIVSYLITGKGMGAGGHAASIYGGVGIHDNGFFQLLLEFGLLGALIFVPLIVSTLFRGIKYFKLFGIETMVVIYYLLSNIGANVFSYSFFITPIFWFCVGRIWNNNYYQRRIIET